MGFNTFIIWMASREDSSSWQVDKQNAVGRQFLKIRAMAEKRQCSKDIGLDVSATCDLHADMKLLG